MSSPDSCKDGASKLSNDDVCAVVEKLQKISTNDKGDMVLWVCANCGKEGSDINNKVLQRRLQKGTQKEA